MLLILRVLRFALVIGLGLAFVLFVWPTSFRYDHVVVEGDTYPVRINRVNGDADMLTPDDGWVPMEPGVSNQQNQAHGGTRI